MVASLKSKWGDGWRSRVKSMWDKVIGRLGFNRRKKVRFQPEANVYEFERQLLGGGGVPENDAMSLGLGPKLVSNYSLPLAEKFGKDEYASSGYLAEDERARLLSQWERPKSLEARINRDVGPELTMLRQYRKETETNPRDQRMMPTTQTEAIQMGSKDEAVARRVAAVPTKPRCVRCAVERW